jgi:hypothetical protein
VSYPKILQSVSDGYVVRPDDITFLGLNPVAVTSFCGRKSPLGMTQTQYSGFKTTLLDAIKREGIRKVDGRLKGSSVEFFSGHHKAMPFRDRRLDRYAIVEEFRKGRGRPPTQLELKTIEDELLKQWPPESHRPRRRPFDAFFKLGINREPSDYDVNLSSDEIMSRVVDIIKGLGLIPKKELIEQKPYGFIRKDIFSLACPEIEGWRRAQTTALGRPVTVAAFPGSGPPDVSKKIGPLSSHFRTTDWRVVKRNVK